MALGRNRRKAAEEKAAGLPAPGPMESANPAPIDPSDLPETGVPVIRPGSWVDQPPEVVREFTLAEAREKYGQDGKVNWCINCKNMAFDRVHGLKFGGCLLRPRREAKVEMEFTCEEFERASDL